MKKIYVSVFISALLFSISGHTQNKINLSDYSFEIDKLSEEKFITFAKKELENSQFVFVGEQHGIKEVGAFTNFLFDQAQSYEYKTLCIETDAIAAKKIKAMASTKAPIDKAKNLDREFPYSIPFYNNEDDYDLFTNVVTKGGDIWGIDQTFMVQFRLNFDYLSRTTQNKALKNKVEELKEKAGIAYKQAVAQKDYTAPYIFQYDKATHDHLLSLTDDPNEIEIIKQLWKTKEIYAYNTITKEYYKNNNERGLLMKQNFARYYKEAQKITPTPKVIFKLGANHAAKGLTRTNIYDISNLASELAIMNNMHSVHFVVMGITGTAATGNPFAPSSSVPFDNTKQFPKEIQELIPSIMKKYFVLNLAPLREHAYSNFSEGFKKTIFRYDILVLIKDAEAFKGF